MFWGEGRPVSGLSTTVAAGFWWIRESSGEPSDGPGIAINVVLGEPLPIQRPSPCPRPRIGAWDKRTVLMLNLSASLGLRPWWLHGDRSVDEIPIELWDTHNDA